MADNNKKLARIFERMAQITEILGGNRFKIIAFENAAHVLSELAEDVADVEPTQLSKIEGIGKGTAQRIIEFLESGEIGDYQKMLGEIPEGLPELLNIPGMGPKTVSKFWKEADVTDLASLKLKLDSGELEELKGFGKKKIEQIKKNLAFIESAGQRVRIGKALPLARWFVEKLGELKQVKQVAYAGSLRRGKETIGDIDILVAAAAEDAKLISQNFVELLDDVQISGQGETKSSIRTQEGLQIDLRIVEPESFGAALAYFTGSKEHNVKMRERAIKQNKKLNEYGVFDKANQYLAGATEEDVYQALKLDWIAPQLRENRGELALAEEHKLPKLIQLKDIKAELHAHTTASDGRWSIEQLAEAAAQRGFHTVAITDHSRSQVQANGLDAKRLEKHIQQIRRIAEQMKGTIHILAGSEVDILADGTLDYPDSLLKQLDIVVASPHAALSQDSDKATTRLLKAIENRFVTILGHPTGRIINRREGLSPDIKKISKAAAQRGIALEINANHMRLDLRDTHVRVALEAGCKLAIDTDAHVAANLDELVYGILTARRGGAQASDVINCMSQTSLGKWIKSTRSNG